MPRIERLDPGDAAGAARWDEFVLSCPQATFFHRAGWQPVLKDIFRYETYYLYAQGGDGCIAGVLPLAQVRSWIFGNSLVSLPFASYGGVATGSVEAYAALEAEARRLAGVLKVDFLELRNTSPRHNDWPKQDLYVTFRMPIPELVDDKMLCIPQKRRNMVRKARKLGLRAVIDDTVDNFFPVFATNARDHGTPSLPRAYFERLSQSFGRDCRILSVVNPAGRAISSILCFLHRGEVLAYYAGELPEARGTAANDLKYWEVMRWAKSLGCTVFDIGRSKRGTGSFEFKKLWGFTPHPLHYEYCLYRRNSVPQNNPSNVKYKPMIEAWRRLPLGFANWLGPFIVRALG